MASWVGTTLLLSHNAGFGIVGVADTCSKGELRLTSPRHERYYVKHKVGLAAPLAAFLMISKMYCGSYTYIDGETH